MPFARWNNFEECVLEMKKLNHDEESANAICGDIKNRAEKGILYKADPIGLEILSKADDENLVVGGFASWEIEDDEGDTITVDAQVKGLQRFFNQAPEWQSITVNHKEFKLAQPQLKYTNSKGETFYSHVNEKGTYLISKIRNDNLKTTQFYREAVRKGNITGYSITGLPLQKGATPKTITDIEYHAITLTEKGVMKAVNPKTREVKLISKSVNEESLKKASIEDLKTQLEALYKQRDLLNQQYSPQPREMDSAFAVIYAKINAIEQALRKRYELELERNTDLTKATKQETIQHNEKPKVDVSAETILTKYGFNKANKEKSERFL
jgi:hypothetical protein